MTGRDDHDAIEAMLVRRDVAAFVRGDWDAVADDFDHDAFAGYSGSDDGWRLTFPTLEHYRRSWLEQSRDLASRGADDLEAQMLGVQRLASIDVQEDRALVRKVFDGSIHWPGGSMALDWQTYYFLRRSPQGRWLVTGFAGYLPRDRDRDSDSGRDGTPPVLAYPRASQHVTAGPYSPVVVVAPDRLVVISGQGPLDDDGALVGDDITEQTLVTLRNCRRQLRAAGCDLDDVFKVTVYLADLADWPAFNAVYAQEMPRPLPVRTAVGTSLLLGMRVEVEMWAAR